MVTTGHSVVQELAERVVPGVVGDVHYSLGTVLETGPLFPRHGKPSRTLCVCFLIQSNRRILHRTINRSRPHHELLAIPFVQVLAGMEFHRKKKPICDCLIP